jgi:hypothetical protein
MEAKAMKLRVSRKDPSRRVDLFVHASVLRDLRRYQEYYKHATGDEIRLSRLIEEITKRFMRSDREFQQFLRRADDTQTAPRLENNS